MASIRSIATKAGRGPVDDRADVRSILASRAAPRGEGGGPFSGTIEQIASDIQAMRVVGASELHFDPTFSSDSQTLGSYLGNVDRMYQLARDSASAA